MSPLSVCLYVVWHWRWEPICAKNVSSWMFRCFYDIYCIFCTFGIFCVCARLCVFPFFSKATTRASLSLMSLFHSTCLQFCIAEQMNDNDNDNDDECCSSMTLHIFSFEPVIHRVRKKEATLFSTTTLAFLGRFLQFLYHWKQKWTLHNNM